MNSISVNITSDQLSAIQDTPIEIVPAPLTGEVNILVKTVYTYEFVSTPYFAPTASGRMWYKSGDDLICPGDVGDSAICSQSYSSYMVSDGVGTSGACVFFASPLSLVYTVANNSGNFTGGDGNLTVTAFYITAPTYT